MGDCLDKYIRAATWPSQIKIYGFAPSTEYTVADLVFFN